MTARNFSSDMSLSGDSIHEFSPVVDALFCYFSFSINEELPYLRPSSCSKDHFKKFTSGLLALFKHLMVKVAPLIIENPRDSEQHEMRNILN